MKMIRRLTLLALLLAPSMCLAQAKKLFIPLNKRGDTTFWYKYYTEIAQQLSLPIVPKSKNITHFRIWMGNEVLEIWQDSAANFKGQLILWAEERTSDGEEPTNRIACRRLSADLLTIKKIYDLIEISKIKSLPDQEKIEGWQQGFDGIEYIIESLDNNEYRLKSYWTPKAQGELKEAAIVEQFVQDASNLVNMQEQVQAFIASIPYEYYSRGMTIAIRILPRTDKLRMKKERNDYRKHHNTNNKIVQNL